MKPLRHFLLKISSEGTKLYSRGVRSMKMRLFPAAVLLAAAPMFAQAGPMGPMGHGPMEGPGGPGFFGMRQPVTNAPYSATFTSISTEKLQDGTVLTHTTTRIASRDALGRTREEITMPAHGPDGKTHTMIVIMDPVAHTITHLETDKKIAVVHPIPAPHEHGRRGPQGDSQAPPPPPPAGDQAAGTEGDHHGPHDRKDVTVADLGSRTIDGDTATGKRITRTVPPNAMGNTAPIITTHEEWISSDLKIELSRSDVDPFHGTRTTTVSGLSKSVPAAALFTVPSDYTVQQAPDHAGRGHFGPRRGGDTPPPPPAGM
jgi:hypothetical protein